MSIAPKGRPNLRLISGAAVDNRDGEGVAVLRRSGIAFAFCVLSAVSSFAQSSPSPSTSPTPLRGFVPPYEILRTLRAAGFQPLAPPLREGTTYVVRALDFRGVPVRVVADAHSGAIRDANRIVAGPGLYGPYMPGPYAPAYYGRLAASPYPPPDESNPATVGLTSASPKHHPIDILPGSLSCHCRERGLPVSLRPLRRKKSRPFEAMSRPPRRQGRNPGRRAGPPRTRLFLRSTIEAQKKRPGYPGRLFTLGE